MMFTRAAAAAGFPPGQMQLMVHINPNVIYGAELTVAAGVSDPTLSPMRTEMTVVSHRLKRRR
jgi:Ethanolamine utilization protein EutJ (predicted chaperonin)